VVFITEARSRLGAMGRIAQESMTSEMEVGQAGSMAQIASQSSPLLVVGIAGTI
jgi:hypothetical protein